MIRHGKTAGLRNPRVLVGGIATAAVLVVGAASWSVVQSHGSGPAATSAAKSGSATASKAAPGPVRPAPINAVSGTVGALPAASLPKVTQVHDLAVKVGGSFGARPSISVSGTAPSQVQVQVLRAGAGSAARAGEIAVVQYRLQAWGKGAAATVFDDSFQRREPVAVVVGSGQMPKQWDAALVGRPAGSRFVVALPAAPKTAKSSTGVGALLNQPALAVVDVLAVIPRGAAASGTVLPAGGAGLPAVTSVPGRAPMVTSLAGVSASRATSRLLVKGTGARIDAHHLLVVQAVQMDVATGKLVNSTWTSSPLVLPAINVVHRVPSLTDAPVGSRAVAVLPAPAGGSAQVLLVDVLRQL